MIDKRPLDFQYNEKNDVLTVEEMKYSGDLFRAWSADGLPIGKPFCIIGRSDTSFSIKELNSTEGT